MQPHAHEAGTYVAVGTTLSVALCVLECRLMYQVLLGQTRSDHPDHWKTKDAKF